MFRQASSVRKLCLGLVSALGMSATVALAGPEIEVKAIITDADGVQFEETVQDGTGSTLNLTEMFVGDEQTVTFFVSNVGDEELVLDTPESVSLVASPTTGYSLINQPPAPTIGPGGSRLFRMRVVPQQLGFVNATMFIFSNADNTENANGTFRCDFLTNVQAEEIEIVDCNENGEDDADDLHNGVSEDCNFNDVPDECEVDEDGDGWINSCDNCVEAANPDQLDSNGNGVGDACDIVVCPATFPVCGVDGQEYMGQCEADLAGVEVAHLGPCVDDFECPETYEPVCADGTTYDNLCKANEAGAELDYEGECEEEELVCPDVYEPVCGMDGHTYSNSCYAASAGTTVDYDGECDEEDEELECTTDFDPVCGTDGNTYSNSCFAGSAGTTVAHNGACDTGEEAEGNENDDENNDDLGNEDENNDNQDQEDDLGKDDEQNQDDENKNGFCGAGLLGMVPLMMLGFGGLKTGRIRRR